GAEDPVDQRPSAASAPVPHAKPVPRAAAGHGSVNTATARGQSFVLNSDRDLAKGWKQRARDNLAAIRLAAEIEAEARSPVQ
ncbi:hypothetical protein, partial [Mesorhizobium sp.]|uniref:hypothetical protein n=1 Tax=Mesorhizobium sp. TaxID=1871066 RepID=UPI00257B4AAB